MDSLPSGTVTFLFTDIEGSTKLAREQPDAWEAARMHHHALLREAIESSNGYIFQITGDAFCAAFHRAGDALRAATQAQRQFQNDTWDGVVIRVRMGIHTAEADLQEDGQYHGYLPLSLVQRIMSAAHGGQVLVSQATFDLAQAMLSPDVGLRDMGEHRLKDFPQMQRIYQLVAPALVNDFPPLRTVAGASSNMPLPPTPIIGRQAELAVLADLIADPQKRLLTITGPGGIGKTRLSMEAGRAAVAAFPDGVVFVALAPLADPNSIAPAIAQALGYIGTKNISSIEQLKEGIGRKALLLILDNCEHLIEDVASLASELLSACPHLKIMATSRESLRIPGEWQYAVPAFDLPADRSLLDESSASIYPALTLFAERARAVRSDFSLNANNIATVAAICERLDGLPLAIELIAARMRLMSPETLRERLDAQFILTAGGMRAASERQKTLRDAMAWSYNLLPPEEQRLFAYLSVFSGGFTLEAVEAMCSHMAGGQPSAALISSLLDKSLLKLAPEPKGSSDARYTMLVTIQEYARERLQEMGQDSEIRDRHLLYFAELAEKAGQELQAHHQLEWTQRLDQDRDNLQAAFDWAIKTGQTEPALKLVRRLHWLWLILSNYSEGRQWLQRVLEMRDAPSYPAEYAEALTQMAHQTFLQIRASDSRPYSELALSIARAHQDKHNSARASAMVGLALTGEEDFAAAESAFEESERLFQEVHDAWGSSFASMVHATLFWNQQDWEKALSLSQQALAGFQELGNRYFQSVTLRHIGIAFVHLGDLKSGGAALRESLILAQQLHSKHDIAQAFWRFAEVARRVNQPVRAVQLLWATRALNESIGAWQREDEASFQDELAPCRSVLREFEFAEATEHGRAMSLEQAIAYALEPYG